MSSPFAGFARRTVGARAVVLLALACAACSPKTPAAPAAAPAAVARPAAEPLRVVSAEAIVISTNASKGMLSLRQSPQDEEGWPEMTIAYQASGGAMFGLNPGDRIAFDLELGGGEGGFVLATRKL